MRQPVRRFILGGSLGIVLGVLGVILTAQWLRTPFYADAIFPSCQWEFRVMDETGAGIPGVELLVIDAKATGVLQDRLWHSIGNWNGPGSLVTDSDGSVTFTVDTPECFGGNGWSLWGYEKSNIPEPLLELRYEGHVLYRSPVNEGQGMITIIIPKPVVQNEQS